MSVINFACPPDMAPHLKTVFEGEYEVRLSFEDGNLVFLDIGANLGAASRWARIVWPNAHCILYEPNPRVHRLLEKNMAHLPHGYEIHKTAVMASADIDTGAAREPTIRLYQGRHNVGEASVFLESGALESDYVDVPVTFAKDLPESDFIKIDAEGPELEILTEYLAHRAPPACAAIEYHSGGSSVRSQKLMASHGYRLIKAIEYELNRGVLVWRHEPELYG